ncbi:MAG: LLM class flavin-dependent oxidoreductase, partial [Pseudoxanthomonas sp.]
SFSLGFLNRVYRPQFDPQAYRDALELFELAEQLGFDSGWVAQHHFGCESGRLPSPLLLLAAAAQRTARIRLGTGVVVLPHEQSLRLAEDAAVLDLLSGGRLELGLGAGFDPETFQAFGQDVQRRHDDYEQRIVELEALLAGAPLPHHPGLALSPPAPTLGARLWEATSRVERVATRGNGLILAPNPGLPALASAEAIRRYRQAWPAAVARAPRVALVLAVFPQADAGDPASTLHLDIRRYVERQQRIGVYPPAASPDFGFELQRLGILHGNVERIAAQLRQHPALEQIDELIVQVQTSGTLHSEATARLRHVALELAPAIGWRPGGPRRQPIPPAA